MEGGFLGFGGVQVSDAEKATLADIAKALGTLRSSYPPTVTPHATSVRLSV